MDPRIWAAVIAVAAVINSATKTWKHTCGLCVLACVLVLLVILLVAVAVGVAWLRTRGVITWPR